MKRLLYILGAILGVVAVVAIAGIAYLNFGFPQVDPAADITIERTAERIARGEYLVKHVTMCLDCHSSKDYTYFSAPVKAGTEGKGGDEFPGVPGKVYSSNITPAALGDWTDGEIARAISAGVDKDGKPLVPMMPFSEYRYLTTEDLYAIVAYLRTMQPIENEVAESSINFPLNLIFRTIPSNPEPTPEFDRSDALANGKYLARVGGCFFCHSPVEQGVPIPGQEFAGNHEFNLPSIGTVRAANLTPDKETGIGSWSKEDFIARFKTYSDSTYQPQLLGAGDMQTAMPWTLQTGMTDEDLAAIYSYLQSLPPVHSSFERFTPVTD